MVPDAGMFDLRVVIHRLSGAPDASAPRGRPHPHSYCARVNASIPRRAHAGAAMALFFFICGANLTHLWKQPVCCRIPARALCGSYPILPLQTAATAMVPPTVCGTKADGAG